jgi:hypothetical protein
MQTPNSDNGCSMEAATLIIAAIVFSILACGLH